MYVKVSIPRPLLSPKNVRLGDAPISIDNGEPEGTMRGNSRRSLVPDLNTACGNLQALFEDWGTYLNPSVTPKSPRDFYEGSLTRELMAAGLDAALFDTDKFPALDDLGIALKSRCDTVPEPFLPTGWKPSEVKPQVLGNPLAQFLLAYIWKLGKFPEVSNVIYGYTSPTVQDAGRVDENAVVMRQFGRHLASPTAEPIFDQHTVRFFKIFTGILDPIDFPDLLVANVDQPSTIADRQEYVSWWKGTPLPKQPASEQVWADRIMFSLGKAAKTLGKTLTKAGRGGGHSKSRGRRLSKIVMAQELVALNPSLPIAEMRPLLMEKLNISVGHANTYFYSARRRLGYRN